MDYFIQQWPNKTATILLFDGTHVSTFSSVSEAEEVYNEWQNSQSSFANNRSLQDASCAVLS